MSKSLPPELDALLGDLEQAWDKRHGSRPSRHDRLPWVAPSLGRALAARVALVGVAAAAVAIVLLTRTSGPGAVKQALAAIGDAPGDAIVHFTSVTRGPDGRVLDSTEMWAATDPPFAERSILQGSDGEPVEQGASGDELTQYDPAGLVYVRVAQNGLPQGNSRPDFAPDAQQIKAYLQSANAHDDGEITADGVAIHRFTITLGAGSCIYDVDAQTFDALAFTCTGLSTGSLSEHWTYLPRAGNEALLSVAAQHPGARIDSAPLEACGPGRHTAATPPCVVNAPGG